MARPRSGQISPGSSGIEVAVLSKKIGIDLGTSTVLVYVKGEGIVVNEPALMATDERGARVLAVGRAASELLGRGGKARAIRPVRDGDGVDYDAVGAMVQHLIGRIVGRQRIFRPDVMLSVPSMVTGVERRAVLEATMHAGAKSAYLIDKPMAAAIGARVPVATTDGILVVNLGAGSTDVAAIAHGEMLALESIRIGGDSLDRAIEEAVASTHGVRLPPGEAERLKVATGSATVPAAETSFEVTAAAADGRNLQLRVSGSEVQAAIHTPLLAIASALQRVIAQVGEDRRPSLQRNGAVLTGGGAMLRGIAEFLASHGGIPARVARDPQSCVAVGTGMALDNLQVIRRGQHYIT
ncbi:MAG: rod shape-determining protein [Chloroflexi bacterium]|nr:MAG: rod shape-determining protein [Chloroflexota bacterium]